MPSNPVMPPEKRRRVGLMRLFSAGLLLFIVSLMIVYLTWDYMPARIQYIPRYLASHVLPAPTHPPSVATPVAVAAPEDTLASLDLPSSIDEEVASEEVSDSETQMALEEDKAEEDALAEEEEAKQVEVVFETVDTDEEEASTDEEEASTDEEEASTDEEEASTDEEEADIDEEEADIDEEEADIDEEEADIDEEEADIDEEEADIDEEEANIDEEEANIDEEEADIDKKEANTDEEETNIDEEEAESDSEEVESDSEESESDDEASAADIETAVEEINYLLPGPQAVLKGIQHEFQGWNNCGPATLGMQLSFFGRTDKQADTAPFLKPSPDDKNVSPDEMVAYAHSIGYDGQVVVGMDLEMLRTFTANELPVIVESWFIPDPDDEMGHYLLLTGYDGETLHFYDSYNGPNVQEQADEFDELWKVFNRTAIVVWPPEKEDLATAILGDIASPQVMYERALATAHAEVKANPQDKYAWFNLGTNLTVLGDIPNAVKAFDTARSLSLPWRMLWYQFAAYEAYFENAQYEEVIALTTTTLESSDNLEESYYWRGRAYAALGDTEAAQSDLSEAVRLNQNFAPAKSALDELEIGD